MAAHSTSCREGALRGGRLQQAASTRQHFWEGIQPTVVVAYFQDGCGGGGPGRPQAGGMSCQVQPSLWPRATLLLPWLLQGGQTGASAPLKVGGRGGQALYQHLRQPRGGGCDCICFSFYTGCSSKVGFVRPRLCVHLQKKASFYLHGSISSSQQPCEVDMKKLEPWLGGSDG